jgi:hypothetical protein
MSQPVPVTKYGFQVLNGENYEVWSVKMEAVLQSEGLQQAIQETTSDTPADAAKSLRARGMIVMSIDDTYTSYVKECENALAVWNKLKTIFQPKSQAQQLQLRQDVGNMKMDHHENISSYYARAQALWSKLASSGYLIEENEVVWSFLSGLAIEFATISLVLRTGDKATSFASVINELLDFERTVHREHPEGYVNAMKARVKSGASKPFVCYWCKEPGHMKRDCKQFQEWREGQGYNTGRRKEISL